jgi:hypothetical protein
MPSAAQAVRELKKTILDSNEADVRILGNEAVPLNSMVRYSNFPFCKPKLWMMFLE